MYELPQKYEALASALELQRIKVEGLLGAGGQGVVFAVQRAGVDLALKWYDAPNEHREASLRVLVARARPGRAFMWPLEMVKADGIVGFGYLMPRIGPEFRALDAIWRRDVEMGFAARLMAGYWITRSFAELHNSGMCYRDISRGNVFVNPDTGGIRICDNDNVGFEGTMSDVRGTPTFMAPEVVREEKLPSADTDRFSLGVLLFELLMLSHPLEGELEAACTGLSADDVMRLYGTAPLFIFHPSNDRNRPHPVRHANALAYWPMYTSELQALFTRTFCDGIEDSSTRVFCGQWERAFAQALDRLVFCPSCGADSIAEPLTKVASCWSCGTEYSHLSWLQIGPHSLVLTTRSRLYPFHFSSAAPSFGTAVARIDRSPDGRSFGLRNLAATTWVVQDSRETYQVRTGEAVSIRQGMSIDFGSGPIRRGEIR